MAIYELLTVTPPIKEELLVSADSVRLRKAAIQEGMSTLLNAGAALVQAGRTTSSEVLRVTRGYEET
jgi:general secretion pathway protein E